MRQEYDHIPTSAESTRSILECGIKVISVSAKAALQEPITLDELHCAIKQGKTNKAPGQDGICLEFYNHTWETIKQDMLDIMIEMYKDGKITYQQKYGIIVCIVKQDHPTRTEDYRPLTLLNTDYKLLARIIANRIRIWMKDILHLAQHYGLSETSL
jgi:hypothetical protein